MNKNHCKQENIRLGTHGEDYGSWMSNPVFYIIGGIGFFASSVFSIIYSLAFQECPSKMNQISGLMITAVAGGGVVTPVLGFAIDLGGITAGLFVVLLCVAYLMYCAFGIKVKKVS